MAAHPPRPGEEYRWDAAAREHQLALAAFLDGAEALDEVAWNRPRAPGRWSPAQIAEHLRLSYETMLRELSGAPPPAVLVGPWLERLLRWFLLPHILYHRHIPIRSRSASENRPPDAPTESRAASLARLVETGQRFEVELRSAWGAGGGYLTNPYFGRMPPIRALRFSAVHVEHHRRQLPNARSGGAAE